LRHAVGTNSRPFHRNLNAQARPRARSVYSQKAGPLNRKLKSIELLMCKKPNQGTRCKRRALSWYVEREPTNAGLTKWTAQAGK